MMLPSYHTHTEFCDGKATAEELILRAIELGMCELGFSAHSPIVGEEDWCMSEQGAQSYREKLATLKDKYKDKIKVYMGIEQDVLSTTPVEPYDYVIGSVHGLRKNGSILAVDSKPDFIPDAISLYYGGDPYLYVEEYFSEVSEVYSRTRCDIIGHFDIVTKFIDRLPLFSTSHPRYIAARDAALEKLLLTPALFEINTGAISRGYRTTPYPDEAVIDRIASSGKPFVISSDAHTRDSLDFGLVDVSHSLDKKGIKYVTSLDEILSVTRA
jgi:histidinol-phosphatase (PHP family)